ncbi:hypothetical protein KST09_03480 [Fusobacterium animalis]|uniref:hypothetical protein n=1 Tax=Fusobacterium animalis TaxID=76859 RepID=UPI0030D24BFF
MKEFKMKAWLKKEKKMVNIIGIDFNYEYIRYTEDGNFEDTIQNIYSLNYYIDFLPPLWISQFQMIIYLMKIIKLLNLKI